MLWYTIWTVLFIRLLIYNNGTRYSTCALCLIVPIPMLCVVKYHGKTVFLVDICFIKVSKRGRLTEFAIDKPPRAYLWFSPSISPGAYPWRQKCEFEGAISPGAYIILNAFGLFSGLDSSRFSESMHQEKINLPTF